MTNLPPVDLTPNPIAERPKPDKPVIRQNSAPNLGQQKPRSNTPQKSGFTATTIPIIIVPAAPTALVTLYNAQQFFLEAVYKPSQKGDKRLENLELERKVPVPKFPSEFHIVDSAAKIKEKDWYKVVAVIAQGQEWQFKGWPKNWASPAEIFSKAKGFYFNFDDERVPDVVNQWNVKTLPINKHKRHLDKTAILNFWKIVDQEVSKRLVNTTK